MIDKARKFYWIISAKMNAFRWMSLVYAFIICQILPWKDLLNTAPATGGDIGSHFYPLHAILQSGSLRPWNPGNLGGEPLLVHYFPLPFMIMAFFSLILPAGFCFNWLYVLPTISLPFCIYFFMKKCKTPTMSSEYAFLLSIIFIFNTSYAAWGGNLYSTLAGQFAHAYALCFLFLLMGIMMDDFQLAKKFSLKGSLLVTAIILSHAYVALCLPMAALILIILNEKSSITLAIKTITTSGFMGIALSLWWLVPSLTNANWTTPYASNWLENLSSQSYLPNHFKIVLILTAILLILILARASLRESLKRDALKFIFAFLSVGAFYFCLIKIFPLVGLVDIRAIPQIHLFLLLAISCVFGVAISHLKNFWSTLFIACSIIATYLLIENEIYAVNKRMEWNWSGWENKTGFDHFMRINQSLKGDFSDPRVAFEHSFLNHKAGTIRAFEMLPYFSGRSVTESLYMQATAFAPSAFYFQSLLGPQKSCPFPNYPCGTPNFKRAAELMPLLGIQDIVISSPFSHAQIKTLPELFELKQRIDPWSIATLRDKVSLVEVMPNRPVPLQQEDWRRAGMNYVLNYKSGTPWVYVPAKTPIDTQLSFSKIDYSKQKNCRPQLKVSWNKLKLLTNCIGIPHVIKLSYHPSFTANNNDPLYLILPSYMGITPSVAEVDITFGQTLDWKISAYLSLTCLILLFVFTLRKYFLKKDHIK